jgi:hypothetical protein
MSRHCRNFLFHRLASTAACAILATAPGCGSKSPQRVDLPRIPTNAGQRAVAQFDQQRTGHLSEADLARCPSIKSVADVLDPQHTGTITAEMINERIRGYRERGIARLVAVFKVLHDGRPLTGATVKLVPEEFLGGNMLTGSGTTNYAGEALPGVGSPGSLEPPSMPCGFYRVEITKPGESIPARYNTDTTLGVEISSLLRPGESSASYKFDLRY